MVTHLYMAAAAVAAAAAVVAAGTPQLGSTAVALDSGREAALVAVAEPDSRAEIRTQTAKLAAAKWGQLPSVAPVSELGYF